MPLTIAAHYVGLPNDSETSYLKPDGPLYSLNSVYQFFFPIFYRIKILYNSIQKLFNRTAKWNGVFLTIVIKFFITILFYIFHPSTFITDTISILSDSVENKLCRVITLLRGVLVFINVWEMANDDTDAFES